MLDVDLAMIYGASTKRLNEQVRRNKNRFPSDFMFQLTKAEKNEVVANCDHLKKLKFSPYLPFAFTEYGAVMLASVINTKIAIKASIQVVKAFVKLRQILADHKEFARKLESMEKKYDHQFKVVFDAIRELMDPPAPKRKPIGFKIGKNK